MGYLTEGVLPQKHGERYKLGKLVARYFLHEGILFEKGYNRTHYNVWGQSKPTRC